MALAFAGIGLVAVQADGGAISLGGLALVVLAAAAWGAGNLVIKRAGAIDMVGFMTWTFVVPPIPLLLLSLSFEGPSEVGRALAHPTWSGVASVVYLALFATVIGWAAWGFLLGRYSPGVVAPFSLLVPLFGLVSGAVVLGEALTLLDLAATVLILAGLACIVLRSTRTKFRSRRGRGRPVAPAERRQVAEHVLKALGAGDPLGQLAAVEVRAERDVLGADALRRCSRPGARCRCGAGRRPRGGSRRRRRRRSRAPRRAARR